MCAGSNAGCREYLHDANVITAFMITRFHLFEGKA